MALSEYEKRVLAEMERHLRVQDPTLADKMASTIPEEDKPKSRVELSPSKIALGSILAAIGLAVILLGVALGTFLVITLAMGVLGFALMVTGVLLALSSDKSFKKRDGRVSRVVPQGDDKHKVDRHAERRKRWENR